MRLVFLGAAFLAIGAEARPQDPNDELAPGQGIELALSRVLDEADQRVAAGELKADRPFPCLMAAHCAQRGEVTFERKVLGPIEVLAVANEPNARVDLKMVDNNARPVEAAVEPGPVARLVFAPKVPGGTYRITVTRASSRRPGPVAVAVLGQVGVEWPKEGLRSAVQGLMKEARDRQLRANGAKVFPARGRNAWPLFCMSVQAGEVVDFREVQLDKGPHVLATWRAPEIKRLEATLALKGSFTKTVTGISVVGVPAPGHFDLRLKVVEAQGRGLVGGLLLTDPPPNP